VEKELINTVPGGGATLGILYVKLLCCLFPCESVSGYFGPIYNDACVIFMGPNKTSAIGSFQFNTGSAEDSSHCNTNVDPQNSETCCL
jgi:hypothetical protein